MTWMQFPTYYKLRICSHRVFPIPLFLLHVDPDDMASFLSFVYLIYSEYNLENNKFLLLGGSTGP